MTAEDFKNEAKQHFKEINKTLDKWTKKREELYKKFKSLSEADQQKIRDDDELYEIYVIQIKN